MEIETIKNNSGVKWEMVKLGDYVERIKTWNPTIESPNDYFFYIDLSSVDKDEKIINPKLVLKLLGKDAPSRARQILKKNDVLVSTVRPNLNGVAILNQDYEKATASTGYCILRTKQDLNPLFLYYWVRNEDFVNDMILKSSGASYPAVSDKIIKDSLIPLPPLPVQKRIAEILDAADALRRKDQELLRKYDELAQAIFIDMFGDPVKNEKGWEVKTIKSSTNIITYGLTVRPIYIEEGIPLISARELRNGFVNYDVAPKISNSEFNKLSNKCKPQIGDILFSKTGSIGLSAIVDTPIEFAITQNAARINFKNEFYEINFIYSLLRQESFINKCITLVKGNAVKDLQLGDFSEIKIIHPPIELQRKFSEMSIKLKGLIKTSEICSEESNTLFQTLLQKAFKGELVAE